LFVKGNDVEEVIPITDEFFINFDNENKIIEVEWEQL
jgi:ribosomal 30S subunit maturation factor RimM|tara:strand:- start:623 stop:733 length:111 start_codon:yes stop_codon:yes gene_type:complete